ncbi:hypothetical protein FDP41_011139 [Naegleria fowleri]|uniref:Uncharacterized protein n=1 Tax=Naegleria fowleri TaxID=5763 RepID=A0A6A5C7P5_NAEFO|nr:uncharacterized protein FDP41_011139 [Naegleria fowleri]KAF0983161.1 hypothetical protein FDP41_011139 [Naegleria fowleri]
MLKITSQTCVVDITNLVPGYEMVKTNIPKRKGYKLNKIKEKDWPKTQSLSDTTSEQKAFDLVSTSEEMIEKAKTLFHSLNWQSVIDRQKEIVCSPNPIREKSSSPSTPKQDMTTFMVQGTSSVISYRSKSSTHSSNKSLPSTSGKQMEEIYPWESASNTKSNDEISMLRFLLNQKDQELKKKDQKLDEKDEELRKKDEELRKKDEELRNKDQRLEEKDEELRKKDELIELLTKKILKLNE